MRGLIAICALLAACCALAENDLPFFSGTYVDIRLGAEGIVMENQVFRRVVSWDLVTTSLVYRGEELIAATAPEATFQLGDRQVETTGARVTGIRTYQQRDSRVVEIEADKDGLLFVLGYRVFAGNRPWIAKWVEFPQPTHIEWVFLENLRFPYGKLHGTYGNWGDNGIVCGGEGLAFGLQINEQKPVAICARNTGQITAQYRPYGAIRSTPVCVLALCTGTQYTAAFALQLYWGAYIAHADRHDRPVVFNTWYGYKTHVTDDDCYGIIPIAADMGCDIFVVDDGWQIRYGDWFPELQRFPNGLAPIGEACRANGMEFGFWLTPALTRPEANTYQFSRLVKNPNQTPYIPWGGHYLNCFSTDWADYITQRTLDLVEESGAVFLKLDFTVEHEGCFDPDHPHPPGAATARQVEAWRGKFVAGLRDYRDDFHVYRAQMSAESCADNDFGWYSDWIISGEHDPRRRDPRWWYRSADSTRFGAVWTLFTTPNWCRTGTSPAHLPGLEDRLDALEYNITSVCASFCNLEFSNPLEGITPDETALCRKWIKWFRENQEYLAYSQYNDSISVPYDPWDEEQFGREPVDGVYHLRPKLDGRWGYLCFWNPSDTQKAVTVDIKPSDYFLSDEILTSTFHALNAGWTQNNTGDTLHVSFAMPPLSWEILEVWDPLDTEPRDEVRVAGRVEFTGLLGAIPTGVAMRLVGQNGGESRQVSLQPDGSFDFVARVARGPFTVSCKQTHWLRRTINADGATGDATGLVLSLLNGDVDMDDDVDVYDLFVILANFTLQTPEGDLNEDGWVTLHDLQFVLSNFGRAGDP